MAFSATISMLKIGTLSLDSLYKGGGALQEQIVPTLMVIFLL